MTRRLVTGAGLALLGVALSIGAPCAASPPAVRSSGPALIGTATVIDGDTLDLHGTRIRLHGIDAPERGQLCKDAAGASFPCGGRAAMVLDDLIGRRTVRCDPVDVDRYGRTVAVCRVGDTDLGAALVRAGWAFAYRDYGTAYVPHEQAAAAAKAGLWAGTFQYPWDHRREARAAGSTRHSEAAVPRTDRSCCKTCSTGKACGDTCIPKDRPCHAPPGCACDG